MNIKYNNILLSDWKLVVPYHIKRTSLNLIHGDINISIPIDLEDMVYISFFGDLYYLAAIFAKTYAIDLHSQFSLFLKNTTLDQAKSVVDNFLIKMNKLKSFA